MDKAQIKQKYNSFKKWQEKPHDYKLLSDAVQHCNNCGNDFTGNFCPICSQKAGIGRIGWRSVRQGVMDIWGLGTRSLLYSIWQLLLRPGHLISDYISGKRQVSFPPVKMLFIIAVVFSMFAYWFFPDVLGIHVADEYGVSYIDQSLKVVGDSYKWTQRNYSWFALLMAVLAIFPTWVLFRYSPRHTRHTLPEGFFIQAFLSVIMLVLSLVGLPLGIMSSLVYSLTCFALFGVYYLIVYHYLFGYGLWGTLWRCGFVFLFVSFLTMMVLMAFSNFDMNAMAEFSKSMGGSENVVVNKASVLITYFIYAVFSFGTGFLINLIATRKARREMKQAA